MQAYRCAKKGGKKRGAGLRLASNIGKTRVYGPTESPPCHKPLAERGLKVLGVPIGHAEYVRSWAEARMQEEQELLDQLLQLPDLQCASPCARPPHAIHVLRTVPPMMVAPYAKMHDDAICATLDALIVGLSPGETANARVLAELPAYWVGWADALPVLRQRLPTFAESCRRGAPIIEPGPAAAARALLQDEGWQACPEWRAVLEGARPPRMRDTSLGDWPHGWQSHASRIRDLHFRERVFLPTLRSQAGPHAGVRLTAVPIDPVTTLEPLAMQLALRRRLRLPLHLASRRCGPSPRCGAQVDAFSDHALACPRTGLLARKAKILERAWVRVARKAVGADGQVVPQQWLAHTTLRWTPR